MTIKLRRQVLGSFRDQQIASSINKIANRLRLRFPDETGPWTDPGLIDFCKRGIAKAAEYDIRVEYNVYVFLVAMLLFGTDFDTDDAVEWNREILGEQSLDEDLKTAAIEFQIAMAFGKAV